jgi:hypothetical protein
LSKARIRIPLKCLMKETKVGQEFSHVLTGIPSILQ